MPYIAFLARAERLVVWGILRYDLLAGRRFEARLWSGCFNSNRAQAPIQITGFRNPYFIGRDGSTLHDPRAIPAKQQSQYKEGTLGPPLPTRKVRRYLRAPSGKVPSEVSCHLLKNAIHFPLLVVIWGDLSRDMFLISSRGRIRESYEAFLATQLGFLELRMELIWTKVSWIASAYVLGTVGAFACKRLSVIRPHPRGF